MAACSLAALAPGLLTFQASSCFALGAFPPFSSDPDIFTPEASVVLAPPLDATGDLLLSVPSDVLADT